MNDVATNSVMPFDFLHPKESGDQKAIAMALLECQKVFPTIPKNGKGEVKGRSKTGSEYSYKYKYALFQDIMDIVRPILNNKGILFSQKPFPCLADGNLYLITELEHAETGGKRWVYYPVCDFSNVKQQEIGGNQTYAKRYSLVVLGIVLEEDTDAQLTEARTAARKTALSSLDSQKAVATGTEQPAHDPETGEVQSATTGTNSAGDLYSEIISDKLTERNVVDYRTRVTEGEYTESQKKVLRAAISARELIMNAKTHYDLDKVRENIGTVARAKLQTKALDDLLKAKEAVIAAVALPTA